MKNLMTLMLLVAIILATVSVAYAKRSPPAEIVPVRHEELEYRVPHNQMGCVECWNIKHNRQVWLRQIYVVKYQVNLEKDVQDNFITSLALKADHLVVKNEHGSEYQLDSDTLQVKVLKGALVESVK